MGCCCVPKTPIASESNTDLQPPSQDMKLKGILHDMKNDINPIKGAAEIINNGQLTDTQRRMVQAITTSVDKLNADMRKLQSALELE